MKIHATFANRHHEPEAFELIHAWDEFSVDDNSAGYVTSRQEAVDSLGTDLCRWVTVDLNLDGESEERILEVLQPDIQIDVRASVSITDGLTFP